ncbi:hypothetical protein QQF64_000090 [Cirrhinus molitorella]|uniref:AIG1-type G domain-containing protein n=1 Tax=Cirrhinus molitorella TaxID=172907 RepID=A0ABR3NWR3_9TELE
MNNELLKCVERSVPGPHVFLLVIRLDVKYTDEEKNAVEQIQMNFGGAAPYTIILFTHVDALENQTLWSYISESKDLQAVVYQCGGRFHPFNATDTNNPTQVTELLEKIKKMVEDNEGQHYTNDMYEKARKKKEWEAFKQKAKVYGKTALKVIGVGTVVLAVGATIASKGGGGTAATAAAAKAVEVAGGAALANAKLGIKRSYHDTHTQC